MVPLCVDMTRARFRAMIGAGGIGSGTFFALRGNHTLGREESRSGRFLDRRDYCKLHIIAHYVQVLLGPAFSVIPIGAVGDDEPGRRLLQEMAAVGLDLRYVQVCPGEQTLFSFCFLYPDGSGGNLTVDDSACERVDTALIERAAPEFARFAGHGIVLAVPEVPLRARRRLLELGSAHGFLRAAAFTSAELPEVLAGDWLAQIDLLAVNSSEAAVIAGLGAAEESPPEQIVGAALERLSARYPGLWVSFTAGRHGSWSWDGVTLMHVPAFPVQPVGTAGAGDAHLAGILCGLVAGLDLAQAQELGALVAALAVTSPHTIAPEVEREALARLAARLALPLSEPVMRLLGGREST